MSNKPERPLCLEIEDARIAIITTINQEIKNRRIPMYIMEIIVDNILSQLKDGKRKEIEQAVKLYSEQINAVE